ncbi:MAG: PKD domain-containing protein [Lamprobacter sp.]|uniref:PKD domain-containing protein n=1 Tax=Lamprobacter sp. TaxID=3100796 RepID=UPI002B26325A|nr:PKD domain-containing protein [Lamprobacter sp.]MEA3642475.1 PKD domain-containing protein [Lamprobacter sp.]
MSDPDYPPDASWSEEAGAIEHTSPGCPVGESLADRPGSLLIADETQTWSHYRLESRLTGNESGYLGLVFRWLDSENYYRLSWGVDQPILRLMKRTNGRFQLLAEATIPLSPGTEYLAEVEIVDNIIRVFLDSDLIFHIDDSDPILVGAAGLYACGTQPARFDDFWAQDLSASPPLPLPEGGATFAELARDLAPGEWMRVNTNSFQGVWTPAAQRPKTNMIWGSPNRVVSAWSSMAWDPNRARLVFWGGGHANYPGNDVYLWSSDTLEWSRGSLPSDVLNTGGSRFETVDGPFSAPISAHTYDSNEFLPLADRFVVFGGADYNLGRSFTYRGDSGLVRTGPYFWNPARADANKVGGLTGSQVDPGLFPDVLGGEMWENRDTLNGFEHGVNSVTGYAEIDGKDTLFFQAGARELLQYTVTDVDDPFSDQITVVGRRWTLDQRQGAGAYSPEHNIFLRSAGTQFAYWDLNKAGPFNNEVIFKPIEVDPGFRDVWPDLYGLDYDPLRKRFVLWDGFERVWHLIPPEQLSPEGWTLEQAPTPLGPAPDHGPGYGVLGKWKYISGYDVFIGVTDDRAGDIWIYKPVDPGLTIDTETLPLARIDSNYSAELAASGGTPPYNWWITAGDLPPGLDLDVGGTLTGAPTLDGDYSFTVEVLDQNGSSDTADLTLSVAPPLPSGMLLQDGFSTGFPSGWSTIDEGTNQAPSNWTVSGGALRQSSNIWGGDSRDGSRLPKPGTYLRYDAGSAWSDYRTEFTLRSDDDDALGLMFRIGDADNYYRFSWDQQRQYRRLIKKVNGAFTLLAEDNAAFTQGRTYAVTIDVIGDTIEVWIDGNLVFSVTDNAHATGTIAFYSWGNDGAQFGNLAVQSTSGETPNDSPSAQFTSDCSELHCTFTDTSTDSDGTIIEWSWSFGDGNSASSQHPTHDYSTQGSYTVTLTVTNDAGASDTRSQTVTVIDDSGGTGDSTLLQEDFSAGLPSGWSLIDEGTVDAPSNWDVSNGTLRQSSNIWGGDSRDGSRLPKPGTYLRYDAGSAWSDYRTEFTLRSDDDDALGLMFRIGDADNYYRFSWDEERQYRRLVKKVNGAFTLLAEDNVAFTQGRTYSVTIDVIGDTIEVWIDGNLVFSVTDNAHATGTIAFYSWGNDGAQFGNLAVQSTSGETPNDSPSAQFTSDCSELHCTFTDTSTDSDGTIIEWSWSFGDGNSASSQHPTHDYSTQGSYTVTLTVTNDAGASDTRSQTVTVIDDSGGTGDSTLLQEDFSAGLPSGWSLIDEGTVDAPSNWDVSNGTLRQSSNIWGGDSRDGSRLPKPGTYLRYDAGSAWSDYRTEFTLRSDDDDALGLMFRIGDADNYYRFSWDEERQYRRLVKKVNGAFTLLAEDNVAFTQGRTYSVTIDVIGDTIEVWIDGNLVFSVTDNAHATGTIAFYSWGNDGAQFRELNAYSN